MCQESGLDYETALKLVLLAGKIRNIREHGLTEGASTRLLIYAACLIQRGITDNRGMPHRNLPSLV